MGDIQGKAKQIDFGRDKSFFGHPKGLGTVSTMTLCNSFANYGTQAILIYFLYATAAEGGLGFTKANAAQFISLYASLSLMCGIVGSFVADRLLGVRKALLYSRILSAVAYSLLAMPIGLYGYLGSQILLLTSAACAGRSSDALLGKMYQNGDKRRDGGFTITYIIGNIGAAAPVITGTIALVSGYRIGFLFAAVLAFAGVAVYLCTEKKFYGDLGLEPDDPVAKEQRKGLWIKGIGIIVAVIGGIGLLMSQGMLTPTTFANFVSTFAIFLPLIYLTIIIRSHKTTSGESRRVKSLIPIFLCNCFSMLVWSQSTSILAIYAADRVNLNFMGVQFTPAAFQTVPAVMGVVLGILVSALWTKLGDKQPSAPTKIGIGTILWGAGPLFMALPFLLFSADVKVSPLWLVVFYFIIISGEAMTSPVGYSCASAVAPKAFTVQMMTVWSLSQSTGAGLSTLAVNFYKEGFEAQYFAGIGIVTCILGCVIWLCHKKLTHEMGMDKKGVSNHES